MNCAEFEILLCDYLDGTLPPGRRADLEAHRAACPACAEMAADVEGAVNFIERAAEVEPPPELVTRILFETGRIAETRRTSLGWRGRLAAWFEPVLQPRFAMGMAMTILSFSMLGRFGGVSVRQLTPADLHPARVWQAVDGQIHRNWNRAVKYYENLRLVYEVQAQLREWAEQEEAERKANSGSGQPLESAGAEPVESGKE
ncbi:MAG: anti-sigma factor family protein [Bryobacteraceae bacterium]